MIAVVVVFQILESLLHSPAVLIRHRPYLWHEVVVYLLLGDTAYCCILRHEADVGEIVEHGEQRDLRKLGDAREENETLVLHTRLQHGEHTSIYSCACLMLRSVP